MANIISTLSEKAKNPMIQAPASRYHHGAFDKTRTPAEQHL